ncbi:hypothetical protein PUN28_004593 [Cardiocondyla obscurior]|uniref:Uncharacterized protein n=1 Tax=Cardiocondyla obscurior TaxID=286306 RepID=A0AAW2GBL0_9HYME
MKDYFFISLSYSRVLFFFFFLQYIFQYISEISGYFLFGNQCNLFSYFFNHILFYIKDRFLLDTGMSAPFNHLLFTTLSKKWVKFTITLSHIFDILVRQFISKEVGEKERKKTNS